MRLVITEPAAHDLDGIIAYVALDNPNTAERVYKAIVAAAETLQDFPQIGRPGRLPNTRELVVSSLPYLIIYEVTSEVVTILAIFHGARHMSRALSERRKALKR